MSKPWYANPWILGGLAAVVGMAMKGSSGGDDGDDGNDGGNGGNGLGAKAGGTTPRPPGDTPPGTPLPEYTPLAAVSFEQINGTPNLSIPHAHHPTEHRSIGDLEAGKTIGLMTNAPNGPSEWGVAHNHQVVLNQEQIDTVRAGGTVEVFSLLGAYWDSFTDTSHEYDHYHKVRIWAAP